MDKEVNKNLNLGSAGEDKSVLDIQNGGSAGSFVAKEWMLEYAEVTFNHTIFEMLSVKNL